jgi:hypothetical protein
MSSYQTCGVVAVLIAGVLMGCGKDDRQPTIEAPSLEGQEPSKVNERDFSSPTATATSEEPPTVESEDLFSKALSKQRKKDYKGAIELFERACAAGQGVACYHLGTVYRDGVGVKVNDRRAQSWFQLACQKDNIAACDALGH